jgi:hypothetical protein
LVVALLVLLRDGARPLLIPAANPRLLLAAGQVARDLADLCTPGRKEYAAAQSLRRCGCASRPDQVHGLALGQAPSGLLQGDALPDESLRGNDGNPNVDFRTLLVYNAKEVRR